MCWWLFFITSLFEKRDQRIFVARLFEVVCGGWLEEERGVEDFCVVAVECGFAGADLFAVCVRGAAEPDFLDRLAQDVAEYQIFLRLVLRARQVHAAERGPWFG